MSSRAFAMVPPGRSLKVATQLLVVLLGVPRVLQTMWGATSDRCTAAPWPPRHTNRPVPTTTARQPDLLRKDRSGRRPGQPARVTDTRTGTPSQIGRAHV